MARDVEKCLCPLLCIAEGTSDGEGNVATRCLGADCAWWHEQANACSIPVFLQGAQMSLYHLEEMYRKS